MNRKRNNNRRTRKIVQVREDGDQGAARIDRTIASMRGQESSTVVLCKSSFRVTADTVAPLTTDWSYPQIAGTDDFISLAQQFNEFKVKFMKFEVYHTNPSATANTVVSTVHGIFTGGIPTAYQTEASVVDAPDSKYIQPGSEVQKFYWNASGTPENNYQSVSSFQNYGGYRSYTDQVTTSQLVCTVIATACVVFRGRR
jgi:hypothetical protein